LEAAAGKLQRGLADQTDRLGACREELEAAKQVWRSWRVVGVLMTFRLM